MRKIDGFTGFKVFNVISRVTTNEVSKNGEEKIRFLGSSQNV